MKTNMIEVRALHLPSIQNTAPGDVPFIMPVSNMDGDTFALCYPCDSATWGARYALADGRVVRAEGSRINTGDGWREEVDEIVIGWVVSLHRRASYSWEVLS